jgi:hypothetical protein
MPLLFDRKYRLRVGPAGAEGLDIDALHIEFKVKKSDKADDKNTAEIAIYNLSTKSIQRLDKDQALILEGGYFNNTTPLFIGDTTQISTTDEGDFVKTVIKCEEGYVPVREGYSSVAFPAATSVRTILTTLITRELGFSSPNMNNGTLGDSKGLNKVYQSSVAKVGQTSDLITKICKENFLTWSIRDGNVIVYPVDGSTNVVVSLISSASGMIGSPQKSTENANKTAGSKDLKTVFKVKTLLDGTYNIGNLVKVESIFTTGLYRISKVSHEGSFESGDWISNLVLVAGVATP